MPRAATSVATSTSILPERNARSACSRAPWPRSPCTAAAAKPRSLHVGGDLVAGALGAAEDHRQAAALGLQDAGEHLALVHRVRAVDEDLGVRDGALLADLLGADVRRLLHEAARHRHDRAGHGGREQHRLPLGRQQLEDPLDVGQEAQVEHLVGLVEDEHLARPTGRGGPGGPGRAAGRGCRRRPRRPCAASRPAARTPARRRSARRGCCGRCRPSRGRWRPGRPARGSARRRAPAACRPRPRPCSSRAAAAGRRSRASCRCRCAPGR